MTAPHPTSALQIEARCRSNEHYAKAVAVTQPDYSAALLLRDKAMQRKRSVQFPMVVWPTEPTSARDIDRYLTAYAAAAEEERTRSRDAQALDAVIGACERRMGAAVDDPDALLKVLAADLDELLTRVADVCRRLNGASTPTQAIDNDTAAVWRELPPLRREYDDVRAAQTLVMLDAPAGNHRSDHIDDPLASDLILANLDDLIVPNWRQPDNRFVMQGTPPDRRPWPVDDELAQLVWLIVSDAEPWLPTSVELARLHTQRRHRIDPTGAPGNLVSATQSTIRIR
jgi:hypothetical protein